MRANIVLDDDLMQAAMRFTSARSKRALIEEALRTFIEVKTAERQRETYQRRLRQLDAKLQNSQLKQSPAEILREDRDRR